jgi:hypothetical protein
MHVTEAVIDRFERGRAVLRFTDGQELIVAKKDLPHHIHEGSVLFCEFFLQKDAEARRENIARYLLQEILQPNDKKDTDTSTNSVI